VRAPRGHEYVDLLVLMANRSPSSAGWWEVALEADFSVMRFGGIEPALRWRPSCLDGGPVVAGPEMAAAGCAKSGRAVVTGIGCVMRVSTATGGRAGAARIWEMSGSGSAIAALAPVAGSGTGRIGGQPVREARQRLSGLAALRAWSGKPSTDSFRPDALHRLTFTDARSLNNRRLWRDGPDSRTGRMESRGGAERRPININGPAAAAGHVDPLW
jgi:hypothetical protein